MTPVDDDEILYRGVSNDSRKFTQQTNGKVTFSTLAFMDRRKRPSVNRADLCQHRPAKTQVDATDGVTSLVARDVRGTPRFTKNDAKGRPVASYVVDVEPVPLTGIPEHAEIYLHPDDFNEGVYRKMLERLVYLANERQWILPPS